MLNRKTIPRGLTTALIVCCWVLSMAWLIAFEAYPGLRTRAAPGYRSLFREGLLLMDNWMKILINDRPAGYTYTRIESDEENPLSQYVLHNHTLLHLPVMGENRRVSLTARAALDSLYQLQRFSFSLSSGDYALSVDGRRHRGHVFRVVTRGAGPSQTAEIAIPDDVMLHSPLVDVTVLRLNPGQQTRLKTLHPLSMTPMEVTIRSLRRDELLFQGRPIPATVMSATLEGMETISWISDDGRLLRQETPFGWRMEACDAIEAIRAAEAGARAAENWLASVAAPSATPIAQPRDRPALRLRLRGLPPEYPLPTTSRQRMERREGDVAILRLRRDDPPSEGDTASLPDPAPYLNPAPFLQSDAPEIVRLAKTIAPAALTPAARARALHDWVHRNVVKEPTVSVPSALDVLRVMRGDCNEHTYLFVALARAAGVPAKPLVGIVYHEGAFHYHAWPAVFAGRWIEMDPTLGQLGADATHVALAEGDFAEQMKIVGLIGRLRIEPLEDASDD